MLWKGTGRRPVFPAKAITVDAVSKQKCVEWETEMKKKYPDGEDVLIQNHLHLLLAQLCTGVDILMPTNKYALEAVKGFYLTVEKLKENGVQF